MHNILSELLISVDLDYLDWTVDVDWMCVCQINIRWYRVRLPRRRRN